MMQTMLGLGRLVMLLVLILPSVGTAGARAILDYPSDLSFDTPLNAPQSVFHDWEQAEADAHVIEQAWRSEPVTLAWTRLQLQRHIKHKVSPTRAARGLALTHVAMHDAYQFALAQRLDTKLAVSMAAARVLGYLYVSEERAFDRIAYTLAADTSHAPREQLPAEVLHAMQLGKAVGERVVRYAESDGAQRGWNGSRLQWYGDGRYHGPGSWEPTPPYFYYPPDEPFAPGWKTWVLKSGSELRPQPPAFGSQKFLHDLDELIEINQSLSPEQLRIAKFWVDGHGSVTPPGHWNQIAIESVVKSQMDELTTTRLFANLNIALADTFIAVWDAKYRYWTIRPITAAKRLRGLDLKLPILTPPFPSYVSGHAGFSGAAAHILGAYFPEQAKRFDGMAEEAAMSRLYGGIHYRHDNEDGLALGRKVAGEVLRKGKSR